MNEAADKNTSPLTEGLVIYPNFVYLKLQNMSLHNTHRWAHDAKMGELKEYPSVRGSNSVFCEYVSICYQKDMSLFEIRYIIDGELPMHYVFVSPEDVTVSYQTQKRVTPLSAGDNS